MSSKKNDKEAQAGVLKYLEQQNRPYSVVDIVNNLHKAYGKTQVTKALDDLVVQGMVREKTYGKQKVYVYNQDNVPTGDKQELNRMDVDIEALNTANNEMSAEINLLTAKHKSLQSELSLEEATKSLKKITDEVKILKEKLDKLTSGQVVVSKAEVNKVKSTRTTRVGAWRKRKRMATDVLDAILENYPKPKKTLFEEIGIETDEECKVAIPSE